MLMGGQPNASTALSPGRSPIILCTGVWAGLGAGLEDRGITEIHISQNSSGHISKLCGSHMSHACPMLQKRCGIFTWDGKKPKCYCRVYYFGETHFAK